MLHSAMNIAIKNNTFDFPVFVEVSDTISGRFLRDQEYKFTTNKYGDITDIQNMVQKQILDFSGLNGAENIV